MTPYSFQTFFFHTQKAHKLPPVTKKRPVKSSISPKFPTNDRTPFRATNRPLPAVTSPPLVKLLYGGPAFRLIPPGKRHPHCPPADTPI